MAAAEGLFAEHGYESVSIRAINAAAGVNPAAVHYHFGSKEALVAAILEERMDILDRWRRERRHELAAAGIALTPRHVVELLVQPLLDLMREEPDRGPTYVDLLTRLYLGRDPIIYQRGAVVGAWWRDVVDAALSDLPPQIRFLRWMITIDSAFVALSRRLVREDTFAHPALSWEAIASELVDQLAMGLGGCRNGPPA